MEESPSDIRLSLPITAEVAKGPNIEAMKFASSVEESTSMMEDVLAVEEEGTEVVDAMGLAAAPGFLAARKAFILFAYSQVRAR